MNDPILLTFQRLRVFPRPLRMLTGSRIGLIPAQ
jgi:hypothetical protein